jgi:cell division septum initiation protein DivIVA
VTVRDHDPIAAHAEAERLRAELRKPLEQRQREAEEQATRSLAAAQRMADQAINEAKAKARAMVAEAEQRAIAIVEAAQLRAREVTEAAQARARAAEARIGGLRQLEADYRAQLHTLIQGQLGALGGLGTDDGPHGAGQ